jgi:hypothetical protein
LPPGLFGDRAPIDVDSERAEKLDPDTRHAWQRS